MFTQSTTLPGFDPSLGIWFHVKTPRPDHPRPGLFLDRDGVIVEDPGYLSRVHDVAFIPGAASLIAEANRRKIPVVEITNQAGIARGYFGWDAFQAIEEHVTEQLAGQGAALDAVLACPYHPDGIAPWNHPDHPARKPRPGMLLAAGRLLHLDLKRSWIVGDKLDDLQAGHAAGLRGGLHVLTGHGAAHRPAVLSWDHPDFDLRLGDTITVAAQLLDLLTP